ncbi:MAG: hypothetical protein AAGA92_00565 [Planctomycetota bacterium]
MLDLIFLVAAVIGGTVMVCQFLMTLLGMGEDGSDLGVDDFDGGADIGGDADFGDVDIAGDHDTSLRTAADAEYQAAQSSWLFGVVSFRTIIAALAFFGIAGKACTSAGYAQGVSLVIASAVGLAAMYGMYWLMLSISKLTSSGNQRIGLARGKEATVYIPVPAGDGGVGKVQLTMQNRIVEYAAVTDDAEPLKTGETVEVVEIVGTDTLRVRRARSVAEV